MGTQIIQDGIGGHFENEAYHKIINFWSIFKCNTFRITKFWSENSFLGLFMTLGARKGVNPRWLPIFHPFSIIFVYRYVKVTLRMIGVFRVDY